MINESLQQKYVEKLEACEELSGDDPELAHHDADTLLCELLIELGYHEVVFKFEEVEKWYA